ncbi:hypothetical protein DM01DRAFT_297723 [Hesseltinella vesiculosa]|uniref:Protein N-terminal glutamine amidohydrolase n=1 Tax=Hesseltinella vesiculosa TaxID=101127 RepID=A0A1X2G6Z1_9FUNG|nr:hypothetical protein DM01DRAFT_297723 [Hesseltinella vesiculosa]
MNILLKKEDLVYTNCYCEENIYKLCRYILDTQPALLPQCSVVFISNREKKIPMWYQIASKDRPFVIWDYHVIMLLAKQDPGSATCFVYDFDSVLPFPCALSDYVCKSFQPDLELLPEFERCFRTIPAFVYLHHFASDRSHMIGPDGQYLAPPPTYPAIESQYHQKMTLPRYIDMDSSEQPEKYGTVLHQDTFFAQATRVINQIR